MTAVSAMRGAEPEPGVRTCGIGRSSRQGGFTLVELLLALAIIGLIAGLALPRTMPNAGATALRIKAFEIAALLRADRNAALRTGRIVATTVDLGRRRVRSGASGSVVVLPDTVALQLTGVSTEFRFAPDGTASGGELTLARRNWEVSVRVNEVTAAVAVVLP